MTHIYNWLDDNKENKDVEKLWKYFDFRTRDVVWQWNNKNLEPNYLCLCEYKGRTYKFNGISKFGDVWLHSNFNAEHGYVKRVDIDECTNFTYIDKPKIDIKKKHWLKDKNNDNKSRSLNKPKIDQYWKMNQRKEDSYHTQTGKFKGKR